jgi:hypothetical protein
VSRSRAKPAGLGDGGSRQTTVRTFGDGRSANSPNTPDSQPARKRRRHGPYGPRVVGIARFIASRIGAAGPIQILHEVVDAWPDLTAHDLIGAIVLAEALALEPRGSA